LIITAKKINAATMIILCNNCEDLMNNDKEIHMKISMDWSLKSKAVSYVAKISIVIEKAMQCIILKRAVNPIL
jgi:hypothetical protein